MNSRCGVLPSNFIKPELPLSTAEPHYMHRCGLSDNQESPRSHQLFWDTGKMQPQEADAMQKVRLCQYVRLDNSGSLWEKLTPLHLFPGHSYVHWAVSRST